MRDISKSELIFLLKENLSYREIGEFFNRTPSTIKWWLNLFDLKTDGKTGPKNIKSEHAIKMNRVRWGNVKSTDMFNWPEIQKFYDQGGSWDDIKIKFGADNNHVAQAKKLEIFKSRTAKEARRYAKKRSTPMSEETKAKIREKRKLWLAENPEKHPWRNPNKFTSQPCQELKKKLMALNLSFIPEFQPLTDQNRFFSIDIAFPDKKIGIEVNGNQHYERNGDLKKYYKDRYDLITSDGWKLYELH